MKYLGTVPTLFLWWGVTIGLFAVVVNYMFGCIVPPLLVGLPAVHVALIKGLTTYPDFLPVYGLTIPAMVGISLLVRRKWFGLL